MHNLKDLRKNLDILRKKFLNRNVEFNINNFNKIDKLNRDLISKKEKCAVINLSKIQTLIDKKIISPEVKIDLNFLKSNKLIKKNVKKFKILGSCDIAKKINLDTNLLSKSAKDKLTKSGSIFISKDNS